MFYLSRRSSLFIKTVATILVFLMCSFNTTAMAPIAVNVSAEKVLNVEESFATVGFVADEAMSSFAVASANQEPEVVLIEKPVLYSDIDYIHNYTVEDCEAFLAVVQDYIATLNVELNTDMYAAEANSLMTAEVERLESISTRIKSNIDRIRTWEAEYPYATEVWSVLHQRGYSDVIVSAIIGNMMVETSGGTLALKPMIYDSTGEYFGLCQWSAYYNPEVINKPMNYQIEYLCNTIEREFNTFGKCYSNGFTYEDFLAMTDPAAAAKAFAAVYERCASWSYSPRMEAADIAYGYFNLDTE